MDRPTPGTLLKNARPSRLQKLLDAAQHYPCAHCNRQDGTTVAAHCNELALGRGFAHKTPDYLVAYLCNVCHDAVDGRSQGLTLEEKRAMWNRAYVRHRIVVVARRAGEGCMTRFTNWLPTEKHRCGGYLREKCRWRSHASPMPRLRRNGS